MPLLLGNHKKERKSRPKGSKMSKTTTLEKFSKKAKINVNVNKCKPCKRHRKSLKQKQTYSSHWLGNNNNQVKLQRKGAA